METPSAPVVCGKAMRIQGIFRGTQPGVSVGAGLRRRRNTFNPKRKILSLQEWTAERRDRLLQTFAYGGNPEHKVRPGDYGLTPPCNPRPGKTLCDAEREFPRAHAESLLRQGLLRGMVSRNQHNGWPQNVWAVSESGEPFEAQLENRINGTYHGYPMPKADDFRSLVIEEWGRRDT